MLTKNPLSLLLIKFLLSVVEPSVSLNLELTLFFRFRLITSLIIDQIFLEFALFVNEQITVIFFSAAFKRCFNQLRYDL